MAIKGRPSRMTIDIKEIVKGWIEEHLYSPNTPNLETLEAIAQVERGIKT